MSQNQSRYISKLNDRDVIRAFQAVFKKYGAQDAALSFNDPFGAVDESAVQDVAKLAGYSLTHATLRVGPCHWQWTRLKADSNDQHSALYDKLTFSWNANIGQPDRLSTLEISSQLDAALSRPLATVDPGAAAPLASHSEILLAMESATAKVLSEATEHRQELDRAYLEQVNTANQRLASERERELGRLKEEKDRVDAELAARSVVLDQRQRELDDLQKKLDDRNNTHVRREIRSSLLSLAKERLANFAVSKETRNQYFAVHAVSIVGLIALAWGSIRYGSQIVVDASTNTYPTAALTLAVKSATLAAAAIALGSWYLGWLNRWLQRIADAEFRLQQFRLDIERASWLAETVLEWKGTTSEPFPELLAARLSAGLFTSSVSDHEDPKTPAVHLAEALLGAASSAKLKVGEQELVLDRRSMKTLSKTEAE